LKGGRAGVRHEHAHIIALGDLYYGARARARDRGIGWKDAFSVSIGAA